MKIVLVAGKDGACFADLVLREWQTVHTTKRDWRFCSDYRIPLATSQKEP